MKYIMVTNFNRHWDGLGYNKTSYNYFMLKKGMNQSKLEDNTPTIFIKRNKKTKAIEKAWEGRVNNIKKIDKKIYFNVEINKKIECPTKYMGYSEGWYVEEEISDKKIKSIYEPKFFSILTSTTNWNEFENLTYYLLKILGIHRLYDFKKQKGEPDGFFKFGNFVVIYDTTLDENFMKSKITQIKNFCSQLEEGSIKIDNDEIKLDRCNKNVWIITKEGSSKIIKKIEDITVKRIPITSLIGLYHERLVKRMDKFELEKELQSL